MATLPPLPRPPDPSVQRFTAAGKPTSAQVEYENRLFAFLKALGDAAVSIAGALGLNQGS